MPGQKNLCVGVYRSIEKGKNLFIQASTPEEMLEKIKSIDWSNIKETETGSNHIDFSV